MGSSSPSPISTIFVYGSLLADDVVRILLGRVPPPSPAILSHLSVSLSLHLFLSLFSIKGRVYPTIVPAEDKKVTGKVLLGISPPELHILDEFEDVEYERASVNVFLKKLNGSIFLNFDTMLQRNWKPTPTCGKTRPIQTYMEWKLLHMADFLKMTRAFIEEMELPDSKTRVATYESFYKGTNNNPSHP
ncbi:hypothetical protein ACS0TY_032475 [Phlomoides rotata]